MLICITEYSPSLITKICLSPHTGPAQLIDIKNTGEPNVKER